MALTAQLTHFGIHTVDLGRMVDFYTRVMGFVISDQGVARSGANIVFMTQDPECHHQFVLFDGRLQDQTYNPVNQISFRLDSLDTLKSYRKALIAEGITEHRVTDHGNAWALYFKDPEGNPVELYCDTPFYTPQPCGESDVPAAPAFHVTRSVDERSARSARRTPLTHASRALADSCRE
jgi:catechol-2,3-dioxygenase